MMCRSFLSQLAGVAVLVGVTTMGAFGANASGSAADHAAPYELISVEGSNLVGIKLIDSAIARLGIETTKVVTSVANRRFVIGGKIVTSGNAIIAAALTTDTAPALAEKWVSFPITADVEKSISLSIHIRSRAGASDEWLEATPDLTRNDGVTSATGGQLFYKIFGDTTSLIDGEIVLVEVPYAKNGQEHKTVPYSSVIYDKNGDEWVFASPEPGVFVRVPIDIAYIQDDLVLLNEGPEAGTLVVTVGASELLGTEFKVGH